MYIAAIDLLWTISHHTTRGPYRLNTNHCQTNSASLTALLSFLFIYFPHFPLNFTFTEFHPLASSPLTATNWGGCGLAFASLKTCEDIFFKLLLMPYNTHRDTQTHTHPQNVIHPFPQTFWLAEWAGSGFELVILRQ